ncbi:MAG: bifunctional glutamate N-acetyltransferase/amino-acid acetyltransferase ArgJ [Pirellulaceae bacterium]
MNGIVPGGFRLAGVNCGIKSNPAKLDLTLIVSDQSCVAAGVYTQNRIFAAPVAVDRARTPSPRIRAVVANSGNANACTGERGLRDALTMGHLGAAVCQAEDDQALVLSTGIIGEFLPMEKIEQGIQSASECLGADETAFLRAARGILTTDRSHKVAHRTVEVEGRAIRIAGMAKGAGMIGPNMATMLGIVLTDANLTPESAQTLLQRTADASFNCISVEGHTSTNDTLLLLASGRAGGPPLADHQLDLFGESLLEMCIELARTIPDDGEGASHLITIEVRGCATVSAARQIAQTVANSALVKTAVAGADPNWGRIVSAAGYAQVPFDPQGVDLRVNNWLLYQRGEPVAFDRQVVSQSMRTQRETRLELTFSEGDAGIRFWTSDLTMEYVKINADYHT